MVNSTLIVQFLPLFGALLVLAVPKKKAFIAGVLALLFALAELILTIVFTNNSAFNWTPAFGITLSFNFDKLSLIVLTVLSGATAVAALYSLKTEHKPEITPVFYSLVLLVLFGTTGVALAADLIQFYVFWELMLIPAWFLVLNWNEEPARASYISLKFFIITHIGAVLMLSSILWIYSITGVTNMAEAGAKLSMIEPNVLVPIAVLFIMGFIVKIAIFPFHTWLPDAYTSSVMPLTLILVGVMTNIGIYGFARFIPFFGTNAFAPVSGVLMAAAVVTIFYGGMAALVEKNIKRLIAYSSISQMGYVLFGFATLLPLGYSASIFNLFNQALTKLTLFISIGIIGAYAGTYDTGRLGGLAKKLPYTALFAMAAVLSLAGAPPIIGFWPEFLTFTAGFSSGKHFITILALLASLISAAYGLRLMSLVFFGPLKEGFEQKNFATHWATYLSAALCFAGLLVFGIYPGLIFGIIRQVFLK